MNSGTKSQIGSTSAYYSAPIAAFVLDPPERVLGILARAHGQLDEEQNRAWQLQIQVLKNALAGVEGTVLLEFEVPRLGSRIDAVVISGPVIFPCEFKCGELEYRLSGYNQAWDYALDLKNFHEASHEAPILPILVATEALFSDASWEAQHADGVRPPLRCNADGLRHALEIGLGLVSGSTLNGHQWGASRYRPTPSIIEAAKALYSRHSVVEISRNDAGAKNLHLTSRSIDDAIEQSRRAKEKTIVFVTGVPGSGKTLVGLNIATKRWESGETHAVFLSGNGPLVAVLQEALVRDELARRRANEPKARKGSVRQPVKVFIQNVHRFRDEGVRRDEAPLDHVVIFDEAQRAWDTKQTSNFMRNKKKIKDFQQSEPEFLISYLNRHSDWAVIICLVGGGQEINTGEAGIAAWLDAVRLHFPQWRVRLAPNLSDSEYRAQRALDLLAKSAQVIRDPSLHLSTSMRSFRSESVSTFVKALLDRDVTNAQTLLNAVGTHYPVALTRDLVRAKTWVREHARGNERYGLVASSKALRLKPHAVDVRWKVDPIHWFLDDANDTRSSYYLEDAATEFQVQGLELDWLCVSWDADLRMEKETWRYHAFRGDSWTTIRQPDRKQYLLNAYRVLLTRARQGMVIFVPPGDPADPTRSPHFYDPTFEYLAGLGIPIL